MPKFDIVYILRDDITTEELKYSLRSVEKNFPHRLVWFVGGQPKGLKPDVRLPHTQTGETKWEKIKSSMWKVTGDDDLSDDFFLFNDDFFIMKPVKGKWKNFVDGTLSERCDEIRRNVHPWLNPYGRTLWKAEQELKSLGCPTMNYDVHLPMLINKKAFRENVNKCSSPQMRSVYGNITMSPYVLRPDVKVYDKETVPDNPDFLSTSDDIFENGRVGAYIRERFPNPSRFEA